MQTIAAFTKEPIEKKMKRPLPKKNIKDKERIKKIVYQLVRMAKDWIREGE